MSAHPHPVPPANRSPKGTGESAHARHVAEASPQPDKVTADPAEQGQQGNTKQNTTNQGYQQDR